MAYNTDIKIKLPGMLKLIQDQHKTQLKQEETIQNLIDRIEQLEFIISQK